MRRLQPDPGPHLRVGSVRLTEPIKRVVIEADGGSRGNPGPAAYGALVKDADTGRVLAEDGTTIGVASNNVAEYSGLIAGLKMAEQVAPGADIEVRMDSKLVVEQMSGNWKIKHPDMRPLAMEANRLAPFGTTYTWVPREQNKHADRLANEALDGERSGVTYHLAEQDPGDGPTRRRLAGRGGREPGAAGGCAGGGRGLPRLVAARGARHHAGAGPPRCDRPHRRQALLRRPGEQQPRPHRRGPGPGPRGRRLAGAAGRGRRGRRHLTRTPYPRVRRDPRASGWPSTWSRSRASPRWSSASGTG